MALLRGQQEQRLAELSEQRAHERQEWDYSRTKMQLEYGALMLNQGSGPGRRALRVNDGCGLGISVCQGLPGLEAMTSLPLSRPRYGTCWGSTSSAAVGGGGEGARGVPSG